MICGLSFIKLGKEYFQEFSLSWLISIQVYLPLQIPFLNESVILFQAVLSINIYRKLINRKPSMLHSCKVNEEYPLKACIITTSRSINPSLFSWRNASSFTIPSGLSRLDCFQLVTELGVVKSELAWMMLMIKC